MKEQKAAYAREYYQRPEVKARAAALQREYIKRPQVRTKRLEGKKRYRVRPEAKALQRENIRQYHKRNSRWLRDLKAKSPCSVCGRSFPDHPSVIDFHHKYREFKKSGISKMKQGPMFRMKAEVDKCIPVCANCHRIIHQRQKTRSERPESIETTKGRQQWYSRIKAAQVCSVCDQAFPDYPSVMEFHHRGDSKKEAEIASIAIGTAVPLSQVQVEIDKCIVVCANCHRITHDLDRQKKKGHSATQTDICRPPRKRP